MIHRLLMGVAVLLLFASCWMTRVSEPSSGIVGRVTDSVSGEPLIGATVVVLGTNMGSLTDPDGKYKISAVTPGSYTLRVSGVSYVAQKIDSVVVKSNQLTKLDIQLEIDTSYDPSKIIR